MVRMIVMLKAMASGLPVVAVAAGGLTDILTSPGETGERFRYPETRSLWMPTAQDVTAA